MHITITLMAIAILCGLAWQDFRFREIHLWLFPVLLALLLAKSLASPLFSWYFLLANLCLLTVQASFMVLYCLLRRKGKALFREEMLGMGDVLFFVLLAFAFSPVNFMLFVVLSLLLTLCAMLPWGISGRHMGHIPLAGAQAVLLAMLLLLEVMAGGNVVLDDSYVINLIEN